MKEFDYEKEYSLVIEKVKEKFPEAKEEHLEISDGVISYDYRSQRLDIGAMQQYVNELLGQKVFVATYSAELKLYARNKEEAREFLSRQCKPEARFVSINENPNLSKCF